MNKSVLHWSYHNFQCIPEALLEYDDFLEEIYLKENFITIIPQWLFQLVNLKFLHLSGNLIAKIPDEIDLLENLEFFDISNNRLKKIPESIGKLKKLQRFNVGGNEIRNVPKSLSNLMNLETLDLSANHIQYITANFGCLLKLTEIILSDNIYLKTLPNKLFTLPNLETICANRCGLLYLPAVLSPSITHVRLFNNRFVTHIPMAYLVHIRRFYDIMHPSDESHYNISRHFLVEEKESSRKLMLPYDVRQIHSIDQRKVFSLLDMCLRHLSSPQAKPLDCKATLPRFLVDAINSCPSAICSFSYCGKFLYTEYYFLVVKRLNSSSSLIFSCTFCSKECAENWCKQYESEYYSVKWEILA